ncbi:MAG TPA: ATP-binding protein [Steroidobacter sp.]|uniref:ATP-binding protein n=1 Tax=Steroidobacter sp. TaxID=1978227 RepID=UPI002EDB07D2
MRSLFLRIFLSFWVATLLVLATTAAVAWYRFQRDQAASPDIRQLASEASNRLLVGGMTDLYKWIESAQERYPGRDIYVVRPDGQDILQRPLPPTYRSYANRLKDAGFFGREPPPSGRDDPLLLTPLFTDRDGTVYTVMIGRSSALSPLQASDVRLVVLAFALVISGLVCWWLAHYISKPLERLQSSARSLAAGNLEARVGEEFSSRRDELGVLARDFDTMADHIRTLIASREDLLRAMSHELRSPLARLRVASGLARRPQADIVKQLDRIELEAERLDTLIGQMLQLSQLRAKPTLPLEPVDVTTLLNEVVEDARLEASAADKNVDWTPGESLWLNGDHDLMRSAIENVLRNAVRFTKPGSAVSVSLTREHRDAVIAIEDHGPGVPEAELARIFEPFYRVAESRDRDSGGTGIGLAITARVVGLYQGQVRAQNAASGGLRVEIRLPLRRD